MFRALEKHCGDVVPLGPFQPLSLKFGNMMRRSVLLVSGRKYLHAHTIRLSKRLGAMAERRILEEKCDVIFAVAGSSIVAHLRTNTPIVYLSDATVRLMVNYYEDFTDALPSHVGMADQLERQSIQRSSYFVYPSTWAADSAVRDYGADRSRVSIVPFGANMESPPSREQALRPLRRDRCRLLFVGVYWDRKGGDIAVETLFELERLGLKAELTVVGCEPKTPVHHPNLHFIPFLSKNDPQSRERLDNLYRDSDFFILPTRAECFSIALCEANAYGLPVLTTRTGGLPELVREGLNGFLFPLDARGEQYAARIRDVCADPATYEALRNSSRREFETRLNWDAWGKRVAQVIQVAASPAKAEAGSLQS